jgi:hypothetical protein
MKGWNDGKLLGDGGRDLLDMIMETETDWQCCLKCEFLIDITDPLMLVESH